MISHEVKDEIESRAAEVWYRFIRETNKSALWSRVTIIDDHKNRSVREPDKPESDKRDD